MAGVGESTPLAAGGASPGADVGDASPSWETNCQPLALLPSESPLCSSSRGAERGRGGAVALLSSWSASCTARPSFSATSCARRALEVSACAVFLAISSLRACACAATCSASPSARSARDVCCWSSPSSRRRRSRWAAKLRSPSRSASATCCPAGTCSPSRAACTSPCRLRSSSLKLRRASSSRTCARALSRRAATASAVSAGSETTSPSASASWRMSSASSASASTSSARCAAACASSGPCAMSARAVAALRNRVMCSRTSISFSDVWRRSSMAWPQALLSEASASSRRLSSFSSATSSDRVCWSL
mmetsp:Transcript_16381/g.50112  ORF Transcript_16381/g.50112 Transcript_16381/m.50112 type:complete len:307 (+) Transcript_16381:1246-2166(+)